ncbi:MAG: hypothetical protein LBU39_02705, partial [Desulfobulbaceae bacterium]|nr:hypothetical protein [Desulfobulbaceae bacterium]
MIDFSPDCRAVLIGSLPLSDHRAALEMILRYTPDIPLWPQLPRLAKEGMTRQFIDGFPGLTEDGKRFWIDTEGADFTTRMAEFYEDCGALDDDSNPSSRARFALDRDAARGFYVFCQAMAAKTTRPWTVKGQITGPVTCGIGVRDSSGRAIIHDDNLRDMLARLIASRAEWQTRVLGGLPRLAAAPMLFIDEPAMVGFGSSGFSGISEEMVSEAVGAVIAAIHRGGGVAGVHICANGDWRPVLTSQTDVVSFDAYSYFEFPQKLPTVGNVLGVASGRDAMERNMLRKSHAKMRKIKF